MCIYIYIDVYVYRVNENTRNHDSLNLSLITSASNAFLNHWLAIKSTRGVFCRTRGWSHIYHVLTPVSTSDLPSVKLCFPRNLNQLMFCQPRPVLSLRHPSGWPLSPFVYVSVFLWKGNICGVLPGVA